MIFKTDKFKLLNASKMNFKLRLLSLIVICFFFIVSHAQTNYEDYIASEIILSDEFFNNSDIWVTGLSANGCYSSKIENGFFEITSTCKDTYPNYWIPRTLDATKDFEIESEILFVRGESNNAISLIWGKDDNYNSFYFGISGNGQFKIYQYNGSWIILKDWTVSDLVLKTDYNKITVRKVGSKYYFFLNEKLVLTSDFYPFFGNQIGFHDNQNTTMRAKNLKISYLKPNTSNSNTSNSNILSYETANSKSDSDFQGITLQPYIGISADYILLTGNFDGRSFFTLPTNELILVPKLDPAPGFGVQIGIRSKHVEFDWAYNISMMKYTSLTDGFSGTSTNHFIRLLGVKGYIGRSTEKKVKPYVYFDWSMAASHFEKLAYNSSDPSNFKSANYLGMIVGLGAGLQMNIVKNLALDLRVLPEYYFGTDIKSKGERDYPIKKFNNFLLINSFGINYYFNKK
jgi:hypothetical protein